MDKIDRLEKLAGRYKQVIVYYTVDCKNTASGKTAIRHATKLNFYNCNLTHNDEFLWVNMDTHSEKYELSKVVALKLDEKLIRFKCLT